MQMQKRGAIARNNQTIDHGQHHEIDELDDEENFSPQRLQYSPQIVREKEGVSHCSPIRKGSNNSFALK